MKAARCPWPLSWSSSGKSTGRGPGPGSARRPLTVALPCFQKVCRHVAPGTEACHSHPLSSRTQLSPGKGCLSPPDTLTSGRAQTHRMRSGRTQDACLNLPRRPGPGHSSCSTATPPSRGQTPPRGAWAGACPEDSPRQVSGHRFPVSG